MKWRIYSCSDDLDVLASFLTTLHSHPGNNHTVKHTFERGDCWGFKKKFSLEMRVLYQPRKKKNHAGLQHKISTDASHQKRFGWVRRKHTRLLSSMQVCHLRHSPRHWSVVYWEGTCRKNSGNRLDVKFTSGYISN